MAVGGGDMRCIDRLRDNSTWACLECDGARWGMDGASKLGVKSKFSLSAKKSAASFLGVTGVAGDDDSMDEVSVPALLRKLRSIVEKSESLIDDTDEDDDEEILRMSGALSAWTFVVEISSTGMEICARLIVPGAYLTVLPLARGACGSVRLVRLVRARARPIVGAISR